MLTEKRIKSAVPPAGAKELDLRDEEGLVLRVRRNADGSVTKSWAFWRTVGGKRQRAALGAWPAVDLTEARRRAEHHRRLADSGMVVSTDLTPAALTATPQTFGDLMDTWLVLYAIPRHKDKGKLVKWMLTKHAASIRSVPLASLNKQHITLAILPVVSAGHNKLAGDLFAVLKQICSFAARHDFIAADPVGALRRADLVPRKNAPRERVLSPDELGRLAVACTTTAAVGPKGRERVVPVVPPLATAALWAQIATACRPGELAAATWKHVDLKTNTWTIPAANAKNGRAHTVPLSPFALAAFQLLKDMAAGEPRVLGMDRLALGKCVKDRQHAEPRKAPGKRAWNDALLLDGPWTLHDLRRTAATLMAEAGVAESTIERCLNHAPPTLVRTYQRSDRMDEMRAAFLVLGQQLAEIAPAVLPTLRRQLDL